MPPPDADAEASTSTWTPASTELTLTDEKDRENAESESSDSQEDVDTQPHRLHRVGTMSKDYTDAEEQTILRKFDRRLVLFIALLYMLSFLDRSNIGNARIAGLDTALSLTSSQYSWLLTAFYITYIAFEWMILLYRLIPPHVYISACVLSWGLVASLQSLTTSFTQLVLLRGLLGITEAAFGPGVPFYLSFFYRRDELAYRVGMQIAAAPLATSFASSLAWVIVKLSQDGPVEPWRALFLVEGFPSIIVAIAAWYIIPDSPSTARYLTRRERKVAALRLRRPSASPSNPASGISLPDLLTTLLDPKAYLTALMFFSVNVAFSSLPVFLPHGIDRHVLLPAYLPSPRRPPLPLRLHLCSLHLPPQRLHPGLPRLVHRGRLPSQRRELPRDRARGARPRSAGDGRDDHRAVCGGVRRGDGVLRGGDADYHVDAE